MQYLYNTVSSAYATTYNVALTLTEASKCSIESVMAPYVSQMIQKVPTDDERRMAMIVKMNSDADLNESKFEFVDGEETEVQRFVFGIVTSSPRVSCAVKNLCESLIDLDYIIDCDGGKKASASPVDLSVHLKDAFERHVDYNGTM